jgi:hypothetical protein
MFRKKWIVVLLVFCSSAFAISPVGPPKAGLETGQWSIGLDYAYSEIDFDIDWDYPGLPDSKARNVKSNVFTSKFGYGVNSNFEIYGLLGMTDSGGNVSDDGGLIDGKLNFDSDYEFYGGFGTKLTLLEDEQVSWGLVYQMSFWEAEDNRLGLVDLTGYGYGIETVAADVDMFDILLAIGPTFEMGNWRVYGAPILYYCNGDIELETLGVNFLDGDINETLFGGYIGAEIDLAENSSVYAEYMLTEDSWLFGTGINWKF